MMTVILANIINFIAGLCSILSVKGKTKKKIVSVEFTGSILRIVGNSLVHSWTDAIAKVIKSIAQALCLNQKLNKKIFYIISVLYVMLCLFVTYISQDLRCLVAIIPSVLEFYSLLVKTTNKYRWYIIITKIFWTINNIIFKLYVGIIFDAIVIIGHAIKIKQSQKKV